MPSLSVDVLERELTGQVVELARTLGWLRFHPFDSRRSTHGFPDEILLRDRLVAVELKREKGCTTEHQRRWLRALVKADVEAYVVRPHNLQALAAVLAARRDPDGGHLLTENARAGEWLLLDELRRELG